MVRTTLWHGPCSSTCVLLPVQARRSTTPEEPLEQPLHAEQQADRLLSTCEQVRKQPAKQEGRPHEGRLLRAGQPVKAESIHVSGSAALLADFLHTQKPAIHRCLGLATETVPQQAPQHESERAGVSIVRRQLSLGRTFLFYSTHGLAISRGILMAIGRLPDGTPVRNGLGWHIPLQARSRSRCARFRVASAEPPSCVGV